MEVTQQIQLQQGSCTIFKEENIMSMVVQHNLTAMNSNRQLGITTSGQSKSAEKLSSGYRINRAGDDAAGLKISEKMRSQIRGLNKASSNAQDGVSLIQTAEGALNEAHSILQRMNELAVQGANDTNESIDRDAINEELTALTEELDRISSTTQFNKQNLLDGSFSSKNLQVGANADQKITISIDNMNASTLGLKSIKGFEASTTQTGVKPTTVTYNNMTYTWSVDASTHNRSYAVASFKAMVSNSVKSGQYAGSINTSGKVYYHTTQGTGTTPAYYSTNLAKVMSWDRVSAKGQVSKQLITQGSFTKYVNTQSVTADGPTAMASRLPFDLGSPSVSSYAKANATVSAVQEAINRVSSQRSALGALQNRLEHTIANLDNVSENTQAAESRIRDTDMASEMVEYSKNNILAQAGQSMLAQANQSTQGVLSLLQ
jgi:flagellin